MSENQQLHKIIAPIKFSDGSSLKSRISSIIEKNANIGFSIDISNIDLTEAEKIRQKIISSLTKLNLFKQITIILTSDKATKGKKNSKIASRAETKPKIIIEKVKKIIVIAAGKGGVGKSTITALLAHRLAKEGKKIGIIDADIYGPSIPTIFNLKDKPTLSDNKMIPLENYGIKLNSIGFLTDTEQAISWRGPMVSKALYQLLSLTNWGELDYLLIDTPPGTGDIHLSLLQNYQIDQALLVVTPQKLAELDVTKLINLYQKFNINFAGIIENMSYYQTKLLARKIAIFSGQAGNMLAERYQFPLLAQLPLDPALAKTIDQGGDLAKFTHLINNFAL